MTNETELLGLAAELRLGRCPASKAHMLARIVGVRAITRNVTSWLVAS